jgi:hypothetical protein
LLLALLLIAALACRQNPTPLPSPLIVATAPPAPAVPLIAPAPADQSPALQASGPPLPAALAHYTIQVALDTTNHTFQGHAGVDYTHAEDVPLDRLYFRLYPNGGQTYGNGLLSVTLTQVNGQPVEPLLSLLDSVLEVPLPAPLNPGESVRLDFDFVALVPVDFGGSGLGGGYGIYNFSEGVLALANWYPMLAVYDQNGWNLDPVYPLGDAVYSDAALYTVEVIVEPGQVVVASGVQVAQEEAGEGRRLYRFVSGPARDFFLVASPDFQVLSQPVGGTVVNSYFLPQHAEGGSQALEVAADALEVYTQRFGPYPYAELDIVETPLNNAGGVEYPGLVLIESGRYGSPQDPDFITPVAHEVAHQWWYSTVGNDVIDEPWLDEGLTTYASILYYEQTQGQEALSQVLGYYQAAYNNVVSTGEDAPVASSLAYFQQSGRYGSYGPVVYAKGALFFQALRQEIGDPAFFSALQSYYQAHWFGIARALDLLNAFEQAAGRSLDELYLQWLYSPAAGLPGEPTPPPTDTPIPSTPIPDPPTPTPEPPLVVFAVIGDYGSADENAEKVANLVKSWEPNFIITTGDNNYLYGEAETIDAAIGQFYHSYIFPYTGGYGEGASYNRFFPCLGNHDVLTGYGQPYFDYFTLPGNERYYDFTWGPLHLFAINSNPGQSEPDGVGVSSVQAAWLRDGLAASTSAWNIVYMHYPPYSSGETYGSTDWAQWPYRDWGAHAVLAGHEHAYERLVIDTIPYFVNGAGGGGLYGFGASALGSAVQYNDDYGAMLVIASERRISFQFITWEGYVVDYFEMNR